MADDLEEHRFVATGPNDGFTVRGLTGFYTEAELLDYGANVQGKLCGVYGESVNTPPPTNRTTLEQRTGVCGVGDNYGVVGKGFTTVSVYGENEASGTGVFGVALNAGAIDVAGISHVKAKQPMPDPDAAGIGIVGATESGKGFGVIGLSVDSLEPDPGSVPFGPTRVPKVGHDKDGNLVFPNNLGKGTGVLGASGTGEGGHFESEEGRGAVFSSGPRIAQIRLVPLQQNTPAPRLPARGKVGDLIVIRNTATIVNEGGNTRNIDMATLWLCIPKSVH
jgi:hypothetical protein